MGKTVKKMNGLGWMSLVGAVIAASTIALPQAAKADVTLFEGNNDIPSVLAYLRVDGGLRFVSNVDAAQYKNNPALRGKTTTLVEAGGNDWGTSLGGVYGQLKFNDDLSGVYKIEYGFNAGDNTAVGFNRRAYAGVSSKTFGTLTAGRDMTLANDYIWALDPMGMESTSVASLVNGRNWDSAADQVRYTSPKWAGLTLGAQAQFGNGDNVFANGAQGASFKTVSGGWSAYAQYDFPIVTLEALYDTMQDPNGHYTNLFTSSKEATIGAIVNLKPVTLYLGWSNLQAPDAKESNIGGGATQLWGNGNSTFNSLYQAQYATTENMEWVGAAVQVTPKVIVRGAVYHANLNDSVGSASLYTAGFEYYFAKNFFYYATIGELTNSSRTDFGANVNVGTAQPIPGRDQMTGFTGFSMQF